MLPDVRSRVSKRGWFIEVDLISTMIVLLLGIILIVSGFLRANSILNSDPPAALVPMAPQPRPELQPTAAPPPAQQPPQQNDPSQAGEGASGDASSSDSVGEERNGAEPGSESSGVSGGVEDALRQLGEELGGQAGTNELGKALEDLDLNRAADAMEDLAEQLDDLSEESRENMSQAMQDASQAMEETGEQSLSQSMDEAAESLNEEDGTASEALDAVADDLRQMAGEMESSGMASGAGDETGQVETGSPEPLTRLSGQDGEMDLPLSESPQSGILNPSPPQGSGEGTARGSLDSTGQAGEDAVQSPLLPNTFLWKWRDVVSQYFQR